MLYGAETWRIETVERRRWNVMERSMCGHMYGESEE